MARDPVCGLWLDDSGNARGIAAEAAYASEDEVLRSMINLRGAIWCFSLDTGPGLKY
jgi:hypothetical protein